MRGATTARTEAPDASVPPTRDSATREALSTIPNRMAWLFLFRAVVVTALLVSVLAVRVGTGESLASVQPLLVYATCGLSYFAILAGAVGVRLSGERFVIPIAYAQLVWDAAFSTLLCLPTGGVESPFAFMFFLNVLSAAALLGRKAAIALAFVGASFFAGVLTLHLRGTLIDWGTGGTEMKRVIFPFLTHELGMFLVSILAGYLTEQLRRTNLSLQRTEAYLNELELLYAAVLRSLPSGVLTVNEAGTVVLVNNAASKILQRVDADLVGKPVASLLPHLGMDAEVSPSSSFEFEYKNEGADKQILGGSLARLKGTANVAGHVIVLQDLTELRRLQDDNLRIERLSTLGRFAAGLAHEIRNPLAAMIGSLQLLRKANPEQPGSADEQTMLDIVHREALRLSNLVTDFLSYARPAPITATPTNIHRLTQETMQVMESQSKNCPMHLSCPHDLVVNIDAEQVRQVLWNLLVNAQQAVATAGAEPGEGKIQVHIQRLASLIRIRVEDSGPGIPAEARARVFEPFYTSRKEGTGLGLATSDQIIRAHGGSIQAGASKLGGAAFEISLPQP